MGARKYSPAEKAAILMLAMGEDIASEIFAKMDSHEVRRIASAMARIDRVDESTVHAIMDEFRGQLQNVGLGVQGGASQTQSLLRRVYHQEDADQIAQAIGLNHPPLADTLLEIDVKPLATYLKHELPQTICVVLAHLEPQKMGEVLKELPESMHEDLIIRLSRLDDIDPEMIAEIDDALRREVQNQTLAYQIDGVEKVANMLNQLDSESAEKMLGAIEERDPKMAEMLRTQMFQFQDLLRIEPAGIQLLIQEVGGKTLALALKADAEKIRAYILENMSDRAGSILQEDIDALGKVRVSEVEKAKRQMLDCALQLRASGKIRVLDPDEVYV